MFRRARLALAFFALASLCASPALFADDGNGAPSPDPQVEGDNPDGNEPDGDVLEWLLELFGGNGGGGQQTNGDEFNPQHLPGG